MTDTMQVLLFADYNRLSVEAHPIPALTADDHVLVRVRAAGVCGSDLHGYTGASGRRTPPLIMGHEASGVVAAVGAGVTRVSVGDRVAVQPLVVCYRCPMCLAGRHNLCENRQLIGMHRPGAYAGYLVAPEVNLVRLPDALSDDHAALAEPLAVCIHAVGLAHITPHDSAIVVGAGAIGLITIALLRRAGVGMLIASDIHPARLEAARRLGATHTLQAGDADTAAAVRDLTGGRGVDLAFEAVGTDATVAAALASVRNQGQVVWIGNNKRHITLDMQAVVTRELRVQGTYGMTPTDFERAVAMLADGALPVEKLITLRSPLADSAGLFDMLLASPEVIKCLVIP